MTDEQLKIERAKALQFDDLHYALNELYQAAKEVRGTDGVALTPSLFTASMVLTTANLLKRQEKRIQA